MYFRYISAKNLKQYFDWGGDRPLGPPLGYVLGPKCDSVVSIIAQTAPSGKRGTEKASSPLEKSCSQKNF